MTEKRKSMMDKSYRGLFGGVSNLDASLYFIQVTRVYERNLTLFYPPGHNS